ncbi:MAG TPA: 1-acyl-sn-glycerol-3-phosphate acyltransferase [Kofleriaceae bacterium]|nr:1-acyl-sn-glycerol-3-phosphate acyltransferase [Kofleriaceae bacterium]
MASDRPLAEARHRLEQFNADRERVLAEVQRRVVGRLVARAARGGDDSLEYVLNDVCVSEIKRLEAARRHDDTARWRELAGRLHAMSDDDKRRELERLVDHYGQDVVGNFDPRVYRFATRFLTPGVGFLMSPWTSIRGGVSGLLRELDSRIQVEGPLDALRGVAERGTLVVTPTHSSNMDSIVIGLALERAGLPPVTYGAGKNLFSNPFISFFMHNLGAYRVDRRLRFGLYKEILKEYSTVLLESGYHSLFFPGGTRCRSNEVERHLKLGLLGTTVTAYLGNVKAGAPQKRIYVVPATINYRLVLEAETLVEDYLAETGQSRYIITDDEFSRLGRILEFLRKLLVHEGAVVVRFGRPLDPFGNDVDDDGESRDRAGRRIDPRTYLLDRAGEVAADDQRDAEYTRLLGRRLAAAYPRETVFHATHLLARVAFDSVCEAAGTRDIYKLLRRPPGDELMVADAVRAVGALRQRIAAEPAAGRLHHLVAQAGDAAIVDDAVRGLAGYHRHPVVERHGEVLRIGDLKLVYYYQNRTAHLAPRGLA